MTQDEVFDYCERFIRNWATASSAREFATMMKIDGKNAANDATWLRRTHKINLKPMPTCPQSNRPHLTESQWDKLRLLAVELMGTREEQTVQARIKIIKEAWTARKDASQTDDTADEMAARIAEHEAEAERLRKKYRAPG